MTPAQTEAHPETAFQSCVLDMMESDWLHEWEQEEQRETRRAALEEHHRRREWHEYLMCFTNPYRMTALYEVAHQMTDSEFWPAFRYAYEIADNLYQAKWAMQALLSTNRSGRKAIMSEEERAVYESLPDPVVIYRGYLPRRNLRGYGWTLNRRCAEWFAVRFSDVGRAAEGKVARQDVLAYFNERNEEEILVDPANVRVKRRWDVTAPVELPSRKESANPTTPTP